MHILQKFEPSGIIQKAQHDSRDLSPLSLTSQLPLQGDMLQQLDMMTTEPDTALHILRDFGSAPLQDYLLQLQCVYANMHEQ